MEVSAFQVALLSVLLTWFWVCVVSDPSITPDPIPELQDWLTTGGAYIHPKLQIITNGTYRSVFVSGAVAANETLLRIPDSLILHHMLPIEVEVPENLLGNSYEPLFHTEFLRLVLVLLVEKRKGVKSKWAPYIQALPRHAPGIWAYPREVQEVLSAGYVTEDDQAITSHMSVLAILTNMRSHLKPAASMEEIIWAGNIAKSRIIVHPQLGAALFPYIDMINHHAGEQAVVKYAKGELSTVESGRPLTVGELHLNYGDKSAVGFLAFYGFCPVRERGPRLRLTGPPGESQYCPTALKMKHGCTSSIVQFPFEPTPSLLLKSLFCFRLCFMRSQSTSHGNKALKSGYLHDPHTHNPDRPFQWAFRDYDVKALQLLVPGLQQLSASNRERFHTLKNMNAARDPSFEYQALSAEITGIIQEEGESIGSNLRVIADVRNAFSPIPMANY